MLVAAGVAIAATGAIAYYRHAVAGDPPKGAPPITAAAAVAAGTHTRIDGPQGAIHVWIPAGYEPDTGATIVYVHGLWDTADTAWTKHRLAEQFALGAVNAMYIVPEAPSRSGGPPINYPDLGEVIRIAEDATGQIRGAAWTAAFGHSGAFRTLETWLDEPLLDQVVMIDAMYGEEDPIVEWVTASERRRLILVGQDTVLGTESIADRFPGIVTLDRFPPSYELWPADARSARLLYIRAQYGHMALVDGGIVLPSLLRLVPVRRLPDLPWQRPLMPLPAATARPAGAAP